MQSLVLVPALWIATLLPGGKSERTYLNAYMEPTSKGKASFYKEPAGQEGSTYVGKIYTMKGVLKAVGHYADAGLQIAHGRFIFYFPNGKVESEGDYAMGFKSGVWQRYDEWGTELAEKVYDPSPLENIVYTIAPTMPSFPGGEQAMVTYLTKAAGDAHGATATFVVEKNGDLSEIKVIGARPGADEQIVEALDKAPPFEAGSKDGLPVRVQMRVPLK